MLTVSSIDFAYSNSPSGLDLPAHRPHETSRLLDCPGRCYVGQWMSMVHTRVT